MTGRAAKAVRLAAVAGLVALAVLGGAFWLARSEWGQRWMAAQVHAALGPSVRFAGVGVAPWPPPLALTLEGLEVLGADGVPVARVRRVVGRIRLRALVARLPLLASVRLEGLEAELTRGADGSVSLGGRALATGGTGSTRPSLDVECPRVDLVDGRLTLRDTSDAAAPVVQIEAITGQLLPTRPGARLSLDGRSAQLGTVRARAELDRLAAVDAAPFHAEIEARDADAGIVSAWLPRSGGALTMSGRGRLAATLGGRPNAGQAEVAIALHEGRIAWRDRLQASAPIELSLQGRWGAGALTAASGAIDVAEARAATLTVTALHAAFTADPDGVTLRDGRWRALGGRWRQSGSVRLADAMTVDGAIDGDAIEGAALVGALGPLLGDAVAPARLDGAAQLHLAAKGTVGAALDGQLAISLPTGSAAWATATAAAPLSLSADVGIAAGAVTVRNAHASAARVADRDLTASDLDARFAVAAGVVQIEALRAQAFDGRWSVSGTIPIGGTPALAVAATGINAAHLARAFLTGRREEAGTAGDVDVTATVTGSGGTIALRLASPTLTIGPLVVAQPATASGTLGWSGGALQVSNGRAQLDRVRVAGTDAGHVRAAFASAGAGRLRVAPLTARAFGGAWTVDALLARDQIDATVRADGVALDPLLAALDAGPRSQGASASLNATLRRPRQGTTSAEVAVQLARGRFRFGDLTVVAPARGNGSVSIDGPRWGVADATVSAAGASYAWLHATKASAQLTFGPDQIRFAQLHATLAGAPWQGSGAIYLGAPPYIDGEVAVVRADPDALLRMLGVGAPTLDPDGLDLALRARGTLDAVWRQRLEGNGTLALRGGVLASTGLLRAIVAAVVPSRTLRDGGAPNRLNSLTMTFSISDGSVRTTDLVTHSDDYDLTASGAIGLDSQLNLNSRVTLTPNGIKKMFALGDIPIPGSSLLSLPTIPARIDGSLADPHVHPEATALAGTTARWFIEALVGAPQRVGEAVARPLEMLFGGVRDLVAPRTPTPVASPPTAP